MKILTGLGLGIFTGLFFGEYAQVLEPLGDIYIRLMQMTVLPYLMTALVLAFGSLSPSNAKRMAARGAILLLLIWAFTCLVLLIVPFTFPDVENASFYSSSLVEPHQPLSLTEIYFTSNLFDSLSRNVVPAVVLFSCLVGIGLLALDDKENLLKPLRTWNRAIIAITRMIISLTPIGVFAISAAAAGTMDFAMLQMLEVYFIAFAVAAILLAFIILPLMVTAVTPFSYREVVGVAHAALLTAFVANSAFIVLPILADRAKALMEQHGLLDDTSNSTAEVMIPVMFNFPNAGKLLTLLFVPFAAWLSGAPMPFTDFPTLFAAGIPSYFAKAQIALPFLLDIFGLPHDTFQLYIPTTILTGKFDSMVTAMNLLVFALLGAGAMGGFLVFKGSRILLSLGAIIASCLLSALVMQTAFSTFFKFEYNMDQKLTHMRQPSSVVETIVHRELETVSPTPEHHLTSHEPLTSKDHSHPNLLERVLSRGTLRIGYDPHNLPMSFINAYDELVGFDVEMGQHLAAALGVKAEFVPIHWPTMPDMLENGAIDIMPGVWYRPYWFNQVKLSEPYLLGTVGLAVKDDQRNEFSTLKKIRRHEQLTIGIPLNHQQMINSMDRYFGGMNVEYVTLEFWQPFFEGEHPELDAFLMPMENASAWTLLHPEYTVVAPKPNPVKLSSSFGLPLYDTAFGERVNEWVTFAINAGIVEQSYYYWIEGKGAESTKPRWSIVRDVLHWVE
ncbi:cation:dicarboxylate symporter family transporter [Pseudomaricurvus sp.]|uniref:cation:dicarboxylate symporter family transporter n=1 Tax=Pseudomaricurvus sp. TaxID=2004510 RepID=UPI003F6C960F